MYAMAEPPCLLGEQPNSGAHSEQPPRVAGRRSVASYETVTMEIETTDYHTAGEPFRIVLDGQVAIPGTTVGDRREAAEVSPEIDRVRRMLCHEPRGHADMYGCFLVPPDDAGADLGVLFWHKDGYSTACGHGTIALGAWAVESGRVAAPADGDVDVTIDVPSGRVVARVRCRSGLVEDVTFRNVPSFVAGRGVLVGNVHVDVAYGGAFYAFVSASDLQLACRGKRPPRPHRGRPGDQGRAER